MIQGLYAAANGMMAVEDRQAVIANNIANATTPGFKGQVAVQRGFYQTYFETGRSPHHFQVEKAPGGGMKLTETFSNYTNGMIRDTGNPLDLALIGPGFFQVQTGQGVMYTRAGQFTISETGMMVTGNGDAVLDVDGNPIEIGDGLVRVDPSGNVYLNGEIQTQLGIIEFEDPHALTRAGFTFFSAPEGAVAASRQAQATSIAPASIEASNVQVPIEMANMMMALRAYAANQQVIASVSETSQRLIDQVGGQG